MLIGIISGIFPPDIGGPATYVPKLATYLQDRGHQVKVLAGGASPLSQQTSAEPYNFELVRFSRTASVPVQAAKVFLSCLSEFRKCDLIYAVGYFNQAALAARILGKPFAIKIMGDKAWERSIQMSLTKSNIDQFQSQSDSFRISLLKLLRSHSYRCADLVIAPSRYLQQLALSWGVAPQRVRLIYNAVERPAPIPFTPSSTGLVRAISVGRLVSWKRFDLAIMALKDAPQVELTIVGDGEQRSKLEQMASELKLNDRVKFLGAVSQREVLELMRASDIFMLCSEYEGLPHVLLEARMLGLPIIAARCGGTPEVLEGWEGASLFEAGDLKALSKMLQSAKKVELPITERDNFLSNFNLEKMLSETEQALTQLGHKGTS